MKYPNGSAKNNIKLDKNQGEDFKSPPPEVLRSTFSMRLTVIQDTPEPILHGTGGRIHIISTIRSFSRRFRTDDLRFPF
jgi:hypothetical protein